jgi:hypothetical protein
MHPHTLLTFLSAKLSPARTRTAEQQAAVGKFRESQLKLRFRTPKPRLECAYCAEHKLPKHFLSSAWLPSSCIPHLAGPNNRVCKQCLETSIVSQMDMKPLFEIGCPQCGTAWAPDELWKLMASKRNLRKYREKNRQAQERVFVPVEAQMPDPETMGDLLRRGARCCPCCAFPFIKMGGCGSLVCKFSFLSILWGQAEAWRGVGFVSLTVVAYLGAKCGRYFNVAYAPVLEDGKGNRAVSLNEESNTDLW